MFKTIFLRQGFGRLKVAGHAFVYSTTMYHRVAPVTRGTRLAAVTWIQSLVKEPDRRQILWDLAQSYHLAESQRFATLVQEELNLALGLRDRGVKQAPFRVLTGARMPAVLVELGFLSNSAEEQRLQQTEYRAQLNEALVRAIGRFKTSLTGGEQQAQEALR